MAGMLGSVANMGFFEVLWLGFVIMLITFFGWILDWISDGMAALVMFIVAIIMLVGLNIIEV